MSVKAALLDLDGVVVFTDQYHFHAWARLAAEEGWEFDEEMNHLLRGVSRMESLAVILDRNGLEMPEAQRRELAERKNRYYVDSLARLTAGDLYPGVLVLLDALAERGIRLALCSSSKNAEHVLHSLGLQGRFSAIVTGHDIKHTKPHPEIFLTAAHRLGVLPECCIVFEDAESGVEAAHAAGMRCVGVGSKERLPAADWTITDYALLDMDVLLAPGHDGLGRARTPART